MKLTTEPVTDDDADDVKSKSWKSNSSSHPSDELDANAYPTRPTTTKPPSQRSEVHDLGSRMKIVVVHHESSRHRDD